MTAGAGTAWRAVRLRYLVTEVDERAGDAADALPLLSVSIHRGVLPREELTDRESRADFFSNHKVVQPGEIVVNRMRAFEGGAGMSSVRGMVSSDYAVLRCSARLLPRFFHHLIRSHWFVGEMTSRLRGIGTAELGNVRTPRVNVADLFEIEVAVPSVDLQRAIAQYLDSEAARIDSITGSYRGLVRTLQEKRAAVTWSGASGGYVERPRRHTRVPWLTDLPAHWEEVKLTLVARLGSGHTPSREHPEWWTDCTIPWITTGEVWQIRDDRIEYLHDTREMISQEGLANSAAELCPAGTVVLSRTASAGFSAIMGTAMATSQDYVTWQCGPRLRPRFLLLCLRAMRRDLLERLAMGSTHQTIYIPDIQSIRIPLPPIDEQDAIVDLVWERLRSIDVATGAIENQIDLLLERRQALITAAVTGQLDVAGVAA